MGLKDVITISEDLASEDTEREDIIGMKKGRRKLRSLIDEMLARFSETPLTGADLPLVETRKLLAKLVKKRIKQEINNDPATVGYAGKTPDEQAALLFAPVVVNGIVVGTRYGIVMENVPFAPNTIDAALVTEILTP